VVVTYQPDLARLRYVLQSAGAQVDDLVVVDNASSNSREVAAVVGELEGAGFEQLTANRGIAAALNAGVSRLVAGGCSWLLTLDQDTILRAGAVQEVLGELDRMPDGLRRSTAVVGMSRGLPPPRGRRRRWVERALVVAEHGPFTERLTVITSGNLVRAQVFGSVRYDEDLFVDHVDTCFCADVRRTGLRVLEYRRPTMDHRLGATVRLRRGRRVYEPAERIYYHTRNGLVLLLRGDLPVRVYLRDVLGLSSVYVEVHGLGSVRSCAGVVARGMWDGFRRRLGPRPVLVPTTGRARP
jgi:rhamnosyltransferase